MSLVEEIVAAFSAEQVDVEDLAQDDPTARLGKACGDLFTNGVDTLRAIIPNERIRALGRVVWDLVGNKRVSPRKCASGARIRVVGKHASRIPTPEVHDDRPPVEEAQAKDHAADRSRQGANDHGETLGTCDDARTATPVDPTCCALSRLPHVAAGSGEPCPRSNARGARATCQSVGPGWYAGRRVVGCEAAGNPVSAGAATAGTAAPEVKLEWSKQGARLVADVASPEVSGYLQFTIDHNKDAYALAIDYVTETSARQVSHHGPYKTFDGANDAATGYARAWLYGIALRAGRMS